MLMIRSESTKEMLRDILNNDEKISREEIVRFFPALAVTMDELSRAAQSSSDRQREAAGPCAREDTYPKPSHTLEGRAVAVLGSLATALVQQMGIEAKDIDISLS